MILSGIVNIRSSLESLTGMAEKMIYKQYAVEIKKANFRFTYEYENYNLGQNKMKRLSPIPPKAMTRARRSKNAPFWHH